MKYLTKRIRVICMRSLLFSFWFFILNQAAFSQENGYWDDRFGAGNFDKDNYIHSIGVTDSGDIFASGWLIVNGKNSGLIKWNGKSWASFGAGIGSAYAFLQIGNDLYIGGGFSRVDSFVSANNIAKYNLVTKTWSPLGNEGNNGTDQMVGALAVQGNDLYVGGFFSAAGGIPANHIVKYNTVTKTWTPLGGGVDGTVRSIVIKNGEIYVGGQFQSAGGVAANNIAKWNGHEWSTLSTGLNAEVYALTVCGDDIYAGGIFTKAGESDASRIAKWNISTKAWSEVGGGASGAVLALASNDRLVYVGGEFNYAGEIEAYKIAKWNPANSCWSRLSSGLAGFVGVSSMFTRVNNILVRENEVYVGGQFGRAGGKPSQLFAIWHEPASPKPHAPSWSSVPEVTFREDSTTRIELYQYVTDTEHDLRGGLNFSATVINSPPGANTNDLKIRLEKVIMGLGGRYEYATFSAARNTSGFYNVVFTVTDVCGNAASDTISVTVTPKNGAPIIGPLPELTFNEDDSLLFPISNWYDYVTDVVNPDSALFFRIFSSREVKAVRRDKSFLFTAAPNWFGVSRLKLVVRDRRGLADTTTLVVKVNPVNDPPVWRGLPDSLVLKPGVPTTLNLWEFAGDLETPDSLLHFNFVPNKLALGIAFDKNTGQLKLTASNFSRNGRLHVTVRDWKRAPARDTIFIRTASSSITKAATDKEQLPGEFVLQQNYPNPFSANGTSGNPATTISYALPEGMAVTLKVLNVAGQEVATLVERQQERGIYHVTFNARKLPSGVYFAVLQAGEVRQVRQMLLAK